MGARRWSAPFDTDARHLEPRLQAARRAPPAEVSRARGRPAFAARRLPSGGACVRDARSAGAARKRPTTRASPQPDPLGHLLSRDRGAPEGESGAIRPPSPAAPERVRNERVRYASDDHAAWSLAGSRGPVRPAFAGPRSPAFTEPRGPRAASPAPPRRGSRSAAPEVPSIEEPPGPGHPAFARYRRSGGAFSTGCHQPVENARRRCQVSGWQTHAQARLP
jgi:hypothetical protein